MKVAASRTKLRAWPLETPSTLLERVDGDELDLGIVPIIARSEMFYPIYVNL
jgi:hypothetical protein